MKKISLFLILIFTVLSFNSLSFAHELIPQALKEYIASNPNATPEEIKAFADKQNPEFSENYENAEELLNIVRDQNTTTFDNMLDFFVAGVEHILAGLDHILFVLALLLFVATFRQILKLTATFTIAHSLTIILAGTGLLTLSSNIVEPIIALSIAYVALSSVYFKDKKIFGYNLGQENAKVASVFFFGLFHGLGFAGLLEEVGIPADRFISSLLSFNLGIEAGQLIIVILAFPLIYFFREKTWYPMVIKVIAAAISLIAIFWFFQRVFGF